MVSILLRGWRGGDERRWLRATSGGGCGLLQAPTRGASNVATGGASVVAPGGAARDEANATDGMAPPPPCAVAALAAAAAA
eukprot:1276669-Prymnesium_polylepis.1